MPAYEPGFRSLDAELEDVELDVEGEVPAWVSGSLIRNGPGKFEVGGERVEHWFDGLAMLHKFRFRDGEVAYSNRFLRTDAYREAVEEGQIGGQFATAGSYLDRLRSFLGDPTDNANVNVARVGGEYVALTETPRRVRFDPATLSTRGDLAYADDLTVHHATAHLLRDDRQGEMVGYATEFGRRSRYHVYRVPDDRRESTTDAERTAGAKRIPIASIEVDRPAYIHSFALTPRYAVLVEPPFVVNPVRFLLPGGGGGFVDSYRWRPERGTRFLVVERESGDLVAERRVPALFFFHTVNAFESEGDVVADLVTYEDATIVENLFMGAVAGQGKEGRGERDAAWDPELDVAEGELTRFRVPVASHGNVERRPLYAGIELPRVAPAVRTEPYHYAYGQATRRNGQNGLVKVNVRTGESSEWWAEGCYAGEPIFVPKPTADGDGADAPEDRGVVVAPALDAESERSLLVVLDGETFEERARAQVPHHVPFGFHGEFFPEVGE